MPPVVGPWMAMTHYQNYQVLDGTIRLELDMTSQFLGHQKTLSLGFLWSFFWDLMGFNGKTIGKWWFNGIYGGLMGYSWDLHSGYVKLAIEHGHL